MTDMSLYNELRNTDIVMESFYDMMLDQEGRNRIRYVDIVTEAFANPTKQAGLLNKLYKEIQKSEEIDFGKIPDSKGDITKYVYYDQMYKCIEVLTDLVEGHPTENITAMNKLHQILLTARPDFTFGFRTDNAVIITTYNMMVTLLYEMINVCAVDATEYLRAKLTMEISNRSAKQMRWVTKNANQFIKMYENGQWSMIMKTFKSSGKSMTVASEATTEEAPADKDDSVNMNDPRVKLAQQLLDTPDKIKDAGKKVGSGIKYAVSGKWAPIWLKIPVIVIGLFMILRTAIYYFMNCAGKISDRVKNMSTILKANAAAENNPDALEKQKTMLKHLDGISDVIDYKIVKSEKAAQADMKNANQSEYSPQEINDISGDDFEL